jgi:hypothetical protein
MTDLLVRGSAGESPAPRIRASASVAMTECLRIQASARPQSRLAWLLGIGPLTPDAREWYRSALGELQVARVLETLPSGWRALRSTDPDVAQLLIGPAGVFTIHTRDHVGQRVIVGSGSLLVNGRRTNHLANARHEAVRASRLLSTGVGETVDVTPVIAIVDPGSLHFGRVRPLDVIVLASSQLARVLLRRKRRLGDDAAAALVARATLGGTWLPAEHLVEETRRLETRFARLRAAVESAAHRRTAWLLGVSGLLAAGVFAVFA